MTSFSRSSRYVAFLAVSRPSVLIESIASSGSGSTGISVFFGASVGVAFATITFPVLFSFIISQLVNRENKSILNRTKFLLIFFLQKF